MSDNINVTPGSGATIAAENLSGALVQRVKFVLGDLDVDGGDVAMDNPMPITSAPDLYPAMQNITTQDLVSTVTITSILNQIIITGTPTAGSFASFPLTAITNVELQITGTWTGNLQVETSMDNGTTWTTSAALVWGTTNNLFSFTQNVICKLNTAGKTNVRVRAVAAMTGTAIIRINESNNSGLIHIVSDTRLVTQSITGTGTPAVIAIQDASSLGISVTGSWSATLQFESQMGDGTWIANPVVPVSGGVGETSTTTNGQFLAGVGGLSQFRVRASAFSSGPVSVSFYPTNGNNAMISLDPQNNTITVGSAADGAAVSGSPVQVAGTDGTYVRELPLRGKGVQSGYAVSTQDFKDTGRNETNYFMVKPVVTTASDALQNLTGYKSGAAVGATTTPAVVTSGKTYRIKNIFITYVAVTTAGFAVVTLRANTGGAVSISSPAVNAWSIGAGAATAGICNTQEVVFPDGIEFAAGTGIGISVQGFGATGTAGAVGYVSVAIEGYEY